MKKFAAFLALVALLTLPASVMAAKSGDFELGGYIKLLAYWESTNSVNKNISWVNTRNNARYPNHDGHTRFTAQETRFNFKIKGPEVWGAKTQGYIELDFDPNQDGRQSASQSYTPRLRHAWIGPAAGRSSWVSTGACFVTSTLKPSTAVPCSSMARPPSVSRRSG